MKRVMLAFLICCSDGFHSGVFIGSSFRRR
jgi:hypothetical protein